VSWLVNGREMEGKLVENVGQNVVVSKLTVPQLRREHRNATYKCRAANTHLIPPLEKTVILDVYRECSHRPPRKGNPLAMEIPRGSARGPLLRWLEANVPIGTRVGCVSFLSR